MGYNKAFVVDTSEVRGRLDPFYYKVEFLEMQKKLQKIDYGLLSSLSIRVLDGIHKTPKYAEKGLIFLQANNINEGSIDFTKKLKYISSEWEEEVLRRYTPQAGDVLISKDGTIGISATVPEEFEDFSIFVSVMAIRPKQEVIIPEFLRIMISSSIVQQQILQSTKGAVISHLLIGEAKKIKIPLPSKVIQENIIQIMDNANRIKKENEKRAKELLASIDEYLLDKLDITLPKEEKIVSYEVNSSEVFGNRFDPKYYQGYFQKLAYSLNGGKYKVVKLNKLIDKIKTGTTPNNKLKPYSDKGIIFLRNTNLKSFDIDLKNVKYVKNNFSNNLVYSYKNEVIICIAGTIGLSAVNTYDKVSINQNVTSLVVENKFINKDYLVCYLNSELSLKLLRRNCSVATILYLNNNNLKSLKIPLPPLAIQNEISSHIQSLREEAKLLKKEAKEVLKSSKDEVERIIFGE